MTTVSTIVTDILDACLFLSFPWLSLFSSPVAPMVELHVYSKSFYEQSCASKLVTTRTGI